MCFGDRLRDARKAKGLTQEQVAAAIGVAKSTYTGYEKGSREPDLFKIKKLISILCVDSSWLLGLQEHSDGLTADEADLIKKYRALDERGKSAVMAALDHEYNTTLGEKADLLSSGA